MALNLKAAIPKFLKTVNTGLKSIGSQVKDPLTKEQARVVRNVGTALTVGLAGGAVLSIPGVAPAVGSVLLGTGKAALKNPKTALGVTSAGTFGAGLFLTSSKARSAAGKIIANAPQSVFDAGQAVGTAIEGDGKLDFGDIAKTAGVLGVGATAATVGGLYIRDKLKGDRSQEVYEVTSGGNSEALGANGITDNSPNSMITEKPKSRGSSKKRKKKLMPPAAPSVRVTNKNYININNSRRVWSCKY